MPSPDDTSDLSGGNAGVSAKRDPKSPASVMQRLRNARLDGQSVQNAQVLFVLERFLARVAHSPYQDRLVLKGGILIYLMLGQWTRPTEDLDFLALRIPSESLRAALAEILAVDLEDRLEFDAASMTSEEIREDSGYPCQRFTIPYQFGPNHTHYIKLDLSFGDPVTPLPQRLELHPILEGFQGGTVLGYPVETLLAEKVETVVVRGLANTRSKDVFDLWVLSRTRLDLRLGAIGEALTATAAYRGTAMALDCVALQPAFGLDVRQNQLWNSYVRSKALATPEFIDLVGTIQGFIRPMVAMALGQGTDAIWDPAEWVWK